MARKRIESFVCRKCGQESPPPSRKGMCNACRMWESRHSKDGRVMGDRLVGRFLRACRRDNPERYKEICDKYPVLSQGDIEEIKKNEVLFSELSPQQRDTIES